MFVVVPTFEYATLRFTGPSRPSCPTQDLNLEQEQEQEEERKWRTSAQVWTIADLFEVLKDQFRRLRHVPLNAEEVGITGCFPVSEREAVVAVFREYGWPDMEKYREGEFLAAVMRMIPDTARSP